MRALDRVVSFFISSFLRLAYVIFRRMPKGRPARIVFDDDIADDIARFVTFDCTAPLLLVPESAR